MHAPRSLRLPAFLLGTWVQSDVYGRVFARQYPSPGRYTDSIVVTVSY